MRKKLIIRKKTKDIKSGDITPRSKRSLKVSLKSWIYSTDIIKLARNITFIGLVLAAGTGWVWYSRLYMNPERRFWIAINNSLATPSVVRTLEQGGSGNKVVQDNRFFFSPQMIVNRVDYTQKSATQDTKVVTEGIVLPSEQFLRYASFSSNSDEKGQLDIDSLIGQWAASVSATDEVAKEEEKLSFLSEYVSVVIFGDYPAQYRNEILAQMKSSQVYGTDLGSPIEEVVDGEALLTYQTRIDLKKYAGFLNESFKKAGYGEFPPLNPDNFEEGSSIVGVITIAKKNNSIVKISYNGREEKYTNYGVLNFVTKPTATLTIDELQAKVQEELGLSM